MQQTHKTLQTLQKMDNKKSYKNAPTALRTVFHTNTILVVTIFARVIRYVTTLCMCSVTLYSPLTLLPAMHPQG
jgi:hypothetical protein